MPHDFNLTIPYGLILIAGGLAGYVRKGSTVSLAWGVGSGLVLLFAAFLSHSSSKKRMNSYIAFILETVVALGLTWVLGQRFLKSYKIVPAGAITGLSFLMALFYLYKIARGGNRHSIPSTKAE